MSLAVKPWFWQKVKMFLFDRVISLFRRIFNLPENSEDEHDHDKKSYIPITEKKAVICWCILWNVNKYLAL